VSINELIVAVSLALETATFPCAAADTNADGMVGINELVLAVGNALGGCPLMPSDLSKENQPTAEEAQRNADEPID
jgi:hypothetical protein